MGQFGLRDIISITPLSRNTDPDHTALVFKDRSMTYGQLTERVERLAKGLSLRGFQRGDRLAVLLYNCPQYVELLFAVAHLGGVVVPINYFYKPREVLYAITDSGASWLVTEPGLRELVDPVLAEITGIATVVHTEEPRDGELGYADLIDVSTPSVPQAAVSLDDPVIFQYTSGTTGNPKAAVHSNGGVLFNALTQVIDFSITSADVHLVVPALCWGAGFHDYTLATWWRKGTVVLNPSRGMTGADLCESIEQNRVTTVMLAPTVIRILLADPAFETADLSSLRLIVTGGEPVPVWALERLQQRLPGCDVVQAYGLSEFPVITTFLDGSDAIERRGSAGRATPFALVRILDERGDDVAVGESGEIVVKSPASMQGYHGQVAASGTRLRNGWLHTGDQAKFDDGGFISIDGRVKDMIISGGLKSIPPRSNWCSTPTRTSSSRR